jgi:hypothetical protein
VSCTSNLLGVLQLIPLCRCTLHRSTASIPLAPSHSRRSPLKFCLLSRLLIPWSLAASGSWG